VRAGRRNFSFAALPNIPDVRTAIEKR